MALLSTWMSWKLSFILHIPGRYCQTVLYHAVLVNYLWPCRQGVQVSTSALDLCHFSLLLGLNSLIRSVVLFLSQLCRMTFSAHCSDRRHPAAFLVTCHLGLPFIFLLLLLLSCKLYSHCSPSSLVENKQRLISLINSSPLIEGADHWNQPLWNKNVQTHSTLKKLKLFKPQKTCPVTYVNFLNRPFPHCFILCHNSKNLSNKRKWHNSHRHHRHAFYRELNSAF